MSEPLNHDDPAAEVVVDGRMVRNLTSDEYAATYADGEPHHIPGDVLAAVSADVAERGQA